ncbi:MAG: BamA/TamA family outer membrane protein [Cyclobacteriaceae bacterium]|nr:BamA/TamA family outer membrane protein [Cyclobacteriaceae bacterium]
MPGTPELLYPTEVVVTDSLKIDALINARLFQLYAEGYLAATYSKNTVQDNQVVDFYSGEIYRTVSISKGNMPDDLLSKSGFRQENFQDKPFSHERIVKIIQAALDFTENHGYPFASIKLDSIRINGTSISARLNYQSGLPVVFDSLSIVGSDKVKANYLMAFLGIYKGKPYEEAVVTAIPKKIGLLQYLRLELPPEISVRNGKCTITLFVEDIKVNGIDAIIGLLPNEQANSKTLITGQVDLDLQNLFGSGKQILFQWQRFNVESQMLKAGYAHPNLFRTPINFRMMLDLFKQDTTFLNRSFDFELSLLSKKSSFIGFQTKFYNSTLISTSGLDTPELLLENADNKVSTYGLKYGIARFDDTIYPTLGWGGEAFFSAGQKKIVQNPAISDEYYQELTLNSIQYTMEGHLEKYWKLYKNCILKSRAAVGYIHAGQLFDSDKYRLGGLSTIRGFAERSIFVTGFGILNLETRAILGKESYIMAFVDQALTDDATNGNGIEYLFGTGAGISFNTDAGTFNFVFAMGKSEIQPFGFNYSKIHFGYISRF